MSAPTAGTALATPASEAQGLLERPTVPMDTAAVTQSVRDLLGDAPGASANCDSSSTTDSYVRSDRAWPALSV